MKKIDEQYREKGVQVVAISLDETREGAGQWTKDFKTKFPVVFEPRHKIADAYGVEAIPFNVAIDRDGKIVKIIVGADSEALEAVAAQLAGSR